MTSPRIGLATVFVVAMCLPAAARQPGFVDEVFERINAQRTRHQLGRLDHEAKLERAAQAHAEWMARHRKMVHLQPAPVRFEEHRTTNHHAINRAINAGYLGWDEAFVVERQDNGVVVHARPDANEFVGEIIAAGWNAGPPATQPRTIVEGWMKSAGHRPEILTARYREMGIGVATNGNDTFWCVVFGGLDRN